MEKEKILNICLYGDLFPPDLDNAKIRYRELCKKWHPDSKDGDKEVFEHIQVLYLEAEKDLKCGKYQATNFILLKTKTADLHIKYLCKQNFELGTCYICKEKIIYVLSPDKEPFFKNAISAVQGICYHDQSVKKAMHHSMPEIHRYDETETGEHVLILNKDKDTFPLRNLLQCMNGALPPEHAAWVISRLHNIECFLFCQGIVHNGITIDNIFVNPCMHGISLFGGWWYSGKNNSKMIGTNASVYDVMPLPVKNSKKYDYATDLEAIKQVGRGVCGSENPRIVRKNDDIPLAIRNFLIAGSSSDAIEEYKKWEKTLDAAYGERVFRTINVTEKQIYKKEMR